MLHIWDIYGVRYFMNKNMTPTRRVSCIEITSNRDTANESELCNKLIGDAEQELRGKGFFLTDADAMEDALFTTERVVNEIRHNHEYFRCDRKLTTVNLSDLSAWMKYLRGWRDRRLALAKALGGTANLPPVIPNDYEENWHIENNCLVPNIKKVACSTTTIVKASDIEELPKEMIDYVSRVHGSENWNI